MNNTVAVQGKYRFKRYRSLPFLPDSLKRWLYQRGLLEWLRVGTSPWIKNAVSTASGHGLNIIARRLCNDLTYDLVITQAKIGTGTTAPTAADTDLETIVTDGILVANQGASGATATLEFFISDAQLPDGTYEEFGVFCGDQLFARSLIDPSYTKATNEDTAAEYIFTFTNA